MYNNKNIIQLHDIKLNKISKSNFQMKLTGYGYDLLEFAYDSKYLFAGDFGG